MTKLNAPAALVALVAVAGAAHATPVFQGRLADGTASSACTVSGVTKCAMFYDANLDITILNDWNIGAGFWDVAASVGSAQALAETAGSAQTAFTGWSLPTGDRLSAAGPQNQYYSIWADVGYTWTGLMGQFDGAQNASYWSSTIFLNPSFAWYFAEGLNISASRNLANAVAVRPGDVAAAAVPEPQTFVLVLLGLAAITLMPRKR